LIGQLIGTFEIHYPDGHTDKFTLDTESNKFYKSSHRGKILEISVLGYLPGTNRGDASLEVEIIVSH